MQRLLDCQKSVGHVTEMSGHVAEFGGHDAETAGHDDPKYAAGERSLDVRAASASQPLAIWRLKALVSEPIGSCSTSTWLNPRTTLPTNSSSVSEIPRSRDIEKDYAERTPTNDSVAPSTRATAVDWRREDVSRDCEQVATGEFSQCGK